ncbi:NPC intracellular cholesterol transporter 2 homolog a-like [Ornithodoros turicata]|uniref:NPC intracellular cholesterol transporter 2 homolog a-like n=1 Tax=Ornithodoros turicata TaxID=34597 RepID=UPI003138A4CC
MSRMSGMLCFWVVFIASALFFATLANASFNEVNYTLCGGAVHQVRVDPCVELPCPFKKGRSVNFEMDFYSPKNYSKVSVSIMGKIGNIQLSLPFNQKDGCTNSGLTCPLSAGNNHTVTRSVRVYRIYPKMKVLAIFEVTGDEEDVLACVQVPIHIQ